MSGSSDGRQESGELLSWRKPDSLVGTGHVGIGFDVRYQWHDVDGHFDLSVWHEIGLEPLDVGLHDGRLFHVVYGQVGSSIASHDGGRVDDYSLW